MLNVLQLFCLPLVLLSALFLLSLIQILVIPLHLISSQLLD